MKRRTLLKATAAVGLAQLLSHVTRAAAANPPVVTTDHPRLMLTNFDRVRSLVASDALAADWYGRVKEAADVILDQPLLTHVIDSGNRMLGISREALHRVQTLSFAYAVEGDQAYLDRMGVELVNVCNFPDWNQTRHFLDVAEMTHAVALGYDWWYDRWTPVQRALMETKIVAYALDPGIAIYDGGPTPHKWPTWTNNWNIVCNGGLVAGALAIADVHPDKADAVLQRAFANLPQALDEYRPDGGYPEGAGYWDYALKYLVLLLACLETATDNVQGSEFAATEGISETVDFVMHLAGPTGTAFNYYDSDSAASRTSEIFWMGEHFDRPDHSWLAADGAQTRQPGWSQLPIGLLWYDPDQVKNPVQAGTSLDAVFAHCAVATARSGWEDELALFVAGKAGDNATGHSHMDIGSWVLDALGQRWFVELGSDNYNLPGYFHEPRWTYYRKRPEGQNTLVVSPGENPGQRPDSVGTVVARGTSSGESWWVIDGTDTHAAVTNWKRGWRLFDDRRRVLLQDEISLSSAQDVWWFAHTAATIEISTDGRSATLSRSGEQLLVRITTPEATFLELEAQPLWTSPQPTGQAANAGLRKLTIWMPDWSGGNLVVEFLPVIPGAAVPAPEPYRALEAWATPSAPVATLTGIVVDGRPIEHFAPDNFTYGLPGEVGTVTGTAADGGSAQVLPGSDGAPTRIITTQPGHLSSESWVWPYRPLGLGNFPSTIIASSDDGNVPTNTMDGDPGTRWSAEGDGQWIAYDMGSSDTVSSVRIAWSSGNIRIARFDIEVAAADADEWTQVFTGTSSGTTAGLESFSFAAVTARYLRIVGHGNSANRWNSVTEVEIPGRTVQVQVTERVASLALEVGVVPLTGSVPSQLTATMTDGSAADLADWSVRYVSLHPQVATVSSTGVVAGHEFGSTQIAAIATSTSRRLLHTRTEVHVGDPNRPRYPSAADTYVRDGSYATQSFGTHPVMLIKGGVTEGSGFQRRAFAAFEPAAQTRPVRQVLLHFYGEVSDGNGTEFDLDFHHCEAFDEKITWNTQPAIGARIATVHVNSDLMWRSVDLTAGLQALVAAGSPIRLALVQSGSGLATKVHAREAESVPYLEVVLG